MKKIQLIVSVIGFAVLIIVASVAYNALSKQTPSIAIDPTTTPTEDSEYSVAAVDFTVIDIDENEVQLSDFYGKPIVINFWASWCPPCKEELPDFDLVYGELGDNVEFMMVDLTDGVRETVHSGSEYIEGKGYSFPVYFDTTGEAAQTYGISSIPATVFINGDGNIVAWYEGQLSESMLRQGISLIYEPSQAIPEAS